MDETTVPDSGQQGQYANPDDALLDQVDYAYVNWARVMSNNWDIRLAFAHRSMNRITPNVGIVMSHQHFKALVEMLNDQIMKIEERFGPIEYKAIADRSTQPED